MAHAGRPEATAPRAPTRGVTARESARARGADGGIPAATSCRRCVVLSRAARSPATTWQSRRESVQLRVRCRSRLALRPSLPGPRAVLRRGNAPLRHRGDCGADPASAPQRLRRELDELRIPLDGPPQPAVTYAPRGCTVRGVAVPWLADTDEPANPAGRCAAPEPENLSADIGLTITAMFRDGPLNGTGVVGDALTLTRSRRRRFR
jgi:hypothetical protein